MTRSSEGGRATARRARGGDFVAASHRLARLVRPPSPPACRGARRRASAPIRTASGSPKSCCSRPRSRRSAPYYARFLARWRDVRGAGGGAARGCAQGLGRARLLRPRPQSARLRPRRGRAAWRRISGKRGGVARLARHRRPIPPPPLPRSRSMRRRRPVDGNIERVVARLFARRRRRCRAQNPNCAGWRANSRRSGAPAISPRR